MGLLLSAFGHQATKVGVTVGKLRTHADKKVAEQAKELVKAWKAEVDRQRKSGSAAKDVKKPECKSFGHTVDILFESLDTCMRRYARRKAICIA